VELAPVDVRDASGTPERGRRGPNGAELSDPGRIGGIPKDSRSRTCGHTIPHFPYLPYSAPPWRGFFWRAIEWAPKSGAGIRGSWA